jgi:hypothetical protein
VNTNELINLFEKKFSVASDASFAALLDLDAKQVNCWRSGHWPMPLLRTYSTRLNMQG